MGVDCFPCDHCGECVADPVCIDCVNLDSLTICENCEQKLKEEQLIEPIWTYLIKDQTSQEITVYDSRTDFITAVAKLDLTHQYQHGIWLESPSNLRRQSRYIDALVGKNNYGSMTKADVIELCQQVTEFNCHYLHLYVGFRHYSIKDPTVKPEFQEKHPTCRVITITNELCRNSDHVINMIEQYAQEHNLVERPYLITTNIDIGKSNDYYYYHFSHLANFCWPEQNRDLYWFDSVAELDQAKWNPEINTEEMIWRANRKYLELKIEQAQDKIRFYTKQIETYQKEFNKLN